MNKPFVKINGQKYDMIEPKARMWRKFTEFAENRKELLTIDYIDKHCEVLAEVFEGLTADDLLDNLQVGEVLKLYTDCFRYLMTLLVSRVGEVEEKNAVESETELT